MYEARAASVENRQRRLHDLLEAFGSVKFRQGNDGINGSGHSSCFDVAVRDSVFHVPCDGFGISRCLALSLEQLHVFLVGTVNQDWNLSSHTERAHISYGESQQGGGACIGCVSALLQNLDAGRSGGRPAGNNHASAAGGDTWSMWADRRLGCLRASKRRERKEKGGCYRCDGSHKASPVQCGGDWMFLAVRNGVLVQRYFFPFFAGFLGATFFAGFGADFGAGFGAGFAGFVPGLAVSAAFAFGSGFGGATGAGAGTGTAAAFPFLPFGPGLAAATAAAAAGVPGAACAAAFGTPSAPGSGRRRRRRRREWLQNLSVSVRERSLPSSKSMKTSCANFGYSGNCGVMSNSVISGNGNFCCS